MYFTIEVHRMKDIMNKLAFNERLSMVINLTKEMVDLICKIIEDGKVNLTDLPDLFRLLLMVISIVKGERR